MKGQCSTCGAAIAIVEGMARRDLYRCRPCNLERKRQWRKRKRALCRDQQRSWIAAHPGWQLERSRRYGRLHPEKLRARQLLNAAIRNGEIQRQPCERCGSERAEGHHDDYSKPLEVRWMCKTCHAAWHQENGTAA